MRAGVRRLAWFVGIWALSVLAISVVGFLIRALIT